MCRNRTWHSWCASSKVSWYERVPWVCEPSIINNPLNGYLESWSDQSSGIQILSIAGFKISDLTHWFRAWQGFATFGSHSSGGSIWYDGAPFPPPSTPPEPAFCLPAKAYSLPRATPEQ